MSTIKRVVSGSLATWCKLALTIVSHIVVVPLYLSHWDAETYGIWLSLISATSLITVFDGGHHAYLEAEFLRIGRNDIKKITRVFSDGIFISILLGVAQISIVSALVHSGAIRLGWEGSSANVLAAEQILIEYSLMWLCFGSIGGIIVRLLPTFGYYARSAWWGVFATLISTVVPGVAVCCGGSLSVVGRIYVVFVGLSQLPFYVDAIRLLRKEGIGLQSANWICGLSRLYFSLLIVATQVFEIVRQQGIRLILVPLAGTSAVATFSVNRTGASVALQAVGTITGPIQPEMMRYIHTKDQANLEACFGTIWLTNLLIACPATVVVQYFAKQVFDLWTNNRIQFDPILFSFFSACVLIGIANQPGIAIIRCNNILGPQLVIGFLSCMIAIVGAAILTSRWGLKGAAIALLSSELCSAFCCTYVASKWLKSNGLRWPSTSYSFICFQIVATVVSLILMAYFPRCQSLIGLASCVSAFIVTAMYIRSLPKKVNDYTRQTFERTILSLSRSILSTIHRKNT